MKNQNTATTRHWCPERTLERFQKNQPTATATTATKPVHEVALDERQKRLSVYAKQRQTMLLKFTSMFPLPGLEMKVRDEVAIDAKHAAEAQMRGLDFRAYRPKGDTGHQFCREEPVVSSAGLVEQLQQLDLNYIGGHLQQKPGGDIVSTLNFSTVGEPVPLPQDIANIIASAFASCTVWCNLRYAPDGSQFRLDTVNFSRKLKRDDPRTRDVRRLVIKGNTYDLV